MEVVHVLARAHARARSHVLKCKWAAVHRTDDPQATPVDALPNLAKMPKLAPGECMRVLGAHVQMDGKHDA